jgi:hypothetical protein
MKTYFLFILHIKIHLTTILTKLIFFKNLFFYTTTKNIFLTHFFKTATIKVITMSYITNHVVSRINKQTLKLFLNLKYILFE